MKTNLTILFFFIFCNITFSQNEKETKHTISVNLNYILDQWISKSSELSFFGDEPDHNILALYKIKLQGVDWRLGVAGLNRKESNLNGLLNSPVNKQNQIYTFSMGFQSTKKLWKKWNFTSGADVIFKYQLLKADIKDLFINNNDDFSKIKKESIALNGFMGIQYHLTNHISLSTEISCLLKRTSINSDGATFLFRIDDPTITVPSDDTIFEVNFIAPLALYLNFHF